MRKDVTSAAATGDRAKALIALRDYLAGLIDSFDGQPRDIAPITRQLADVVREIDEIGLPQRKGTALDELAKRRSKTPRAKAARPAKAAGARRAEGT